MGINAIEKSKAWEGSGETAGSEVGWSAKAWMQS